MSVNDVQFLLCVVRDEEGIVTVSFSGTAIAQQQSKMIIQHTSWECYRLQPNCNDCCGQLAGIQCIQERWIY
jgi:hypothetical protein